MSSATLQIRSQTGKSGRGAAELEGLADSARAGKAAAFAVAGLAGAAMCIWIPMVHLLTTWLLPLIGGAMAWKTWNTKAVFSSIEASCPECGAALAWTGRGASFPLRDACAGCESQLEVTEVTED
jgi:hypothetical protein